jgi:hypothetical protein
MAVATLEEVNQYVSREATRRNGKIVPALPGALRKMCNDPHFFIFNVGPWKWERQLGGRGSRTVQACEEGHPYSAALEMPFLDNETVASDMNKMENRQEDGKEVVDAVLMRGYGFKPEDCLENWGVAVIENWPPTAKQLEEPNRKLKEKFDALIAEADKYYEQRKHDDISEFHRLAARRRRLNKGWLNSNPDLVACGACGMEVKPNIARCPHCTAVLDEALDRKFFPEKYRKSA